MSYATNLSNEVAKQNYLAVLKPRRIVSGFTVHSGSVYVTDFDYGQVISAEENGAALALGTSSSLSAGQFFYDTDELKLYVRLSGGGNPNSIFLVATYEIYIGTFDAHFHRVPDDDTTRIVYFDPVIKKSPSIKQTMSDAIFGNIPVESSSISLINAEHFLEKHIHDSSFNNAAISLYHWIGDLEVDNIKLVMMGLMSDITYDEGTVSIAIRDRNDIFKNEFRNHGVENFYNATLFANLDPQFSGAPIRQVYGRVEGFKPVNISFVEDMPTTSDNRTWCVLSGAVGMADRVVTVTAGSTTTQTNVSSTDGINVGDSVHLDRVVGIDEYVLVTAIGAGFITHAAIASPMAAADSVRRAFVSVINIVQGGVLYQALYGRDYTVSYVGSNSTCQFTFDTSLETNLTMPDTLQALDRVSCTVYGRVNNLTLGGPSFGSNSVRTANLANPVLILTDILKRCLGVIDADIDTASFTTALAARTSTHGIVLPDTALGSFPTYQTIIADLLQCTLIQLVLNSEGKWKLQATGPIGASDYQIADDELLSFSASYKYADIISEAIVEYNRKEISDDPNQTTESRSSTSFVSETAKYLHKASRTMTVSSSLILEADADELAERLTYALGDRMNEINIDAKARFFETEIGQVIDISRDKLPGFSYTREVLHDREVVVLGVEKTLDRVRISTTDQKGIEDNSGGW